MNIIYYFKEEQNQMYLWQRYQIIDELENNGHNVFIFNPLNYKSIDEANEELLTFLMDQKYDVFFTAHGGNLLYRDTIKKIKIPTVQICFDNLIDPFQYKNTCDLFDLVWLTSKETSYLFKRWKATTIFLPYACNPKVSTKNNHNINNRICYVGTPYGSRVNHLNYLIKSDKTIDIFTNINNNKNKSKINNRLYKNYFKFKIGWKVLLGALVQKTVKRNTILKTKNVSFKPSLSQDEMFQAFGSYRLVFSTTDARNTGSLIKPVQIVNLRSFEIPMSGGVQFCKYNKELSTYFKDGVEIIFYRNSKDMYKKLDFYMDQKNTEIVLSIKENAIKRALAEHKWIDRFNKIFKELDLIE